MKRTITSWMAVVAVLAVVWAGCAPVEPPDSSGSTTIERPATEVTAAVPTPTPPRITVPNDLRERVEAAIDHVQRRDLLMTNGFWTVFHGILGQGFQTTLLDPETGKRVNAIEHISGGGKLRGLRFEQSDQGLDVQMGPQFVGQGHQDQFIAEMAQWGMKADHKFVVNKQDFTMMDFVRKSQARVRLNDNQELSWAIVLIGQYVGTDAVWFNDAGDPLHFSSLIEYELKQPIESAACGGTHRLFGLAWAYHVHAKSGLPVTGVWQEVAAKLEAYKQMSFHLQNPDGSFSTSFYRIRGIGKSRDVEKQINSTGHIVEWLALAMTDEELRDPRMQKAVSALAKMILDMQTEPIDTGSLYHAVHGLKMYHARMFTPQLVGTPVMPIPLPPKNAATKPPEGKPEPRLPKKDLGL